MWLNFYVCDVPYNVTSVARLPQQGRKAPLSSEGSRLEGPSGESTPVVRYGSLLFLCPKLVSFDPGEYSDFSTSCHALSLLLGRLQWTLADLTARKASAKMVSATSQESKEKEKERQKNLEKVKERVPT